MSNFNITLIEQVAHRQYKTVAEVASGKGHAWTALINVKTSTHDFSVKLSSCICSHTDSSCPGRCWLMWYLDIYQALLGFMIAIFMFQSKEPGKNKAIKKQVGLDAPEMVV